MPNLFENVQFITNETLRALVNKSQIAQFFNTSYNKEFTGKEFKIGDSLKVRYPQRFLIRDGAEYDPQGLTDRYTNVVVDQQFGVDFDWTSAEQALNLDEVKRRYLEPAGMQLASELDSRAALFAHLRVPNVVGTLGTAITTYAPFLSANARLFGLGCTAGEKGMIVTPDMQASVIGSNLTLFNPSSEISRMYKEGSMGKASGFDWYMSNNLYTQTAGTLQTPASVTVNGANQSGTQILINCTAGDTFAVGDRVSIASVKAVNPTNRRSIGFDANFVVTRPFVGVGGGSAADILYISAGNNQGIVGPGDQYQNVDSLPGDTALITLWPGTTSPNGKTGRLGLAMNNEAFAMVGVPLVVPKATELSYQTRDGATGIAVRFVRMYDPILDRMVNRFDVLIGFGELYSGSCAVGVAAV